MSYLSEIARRAVGVELSDEEMKRYHRQLILPELTVEGQRCLKAARVLVVGAGGLGSPVLAYLAAAGVGTIGVVDSDVVDASNLHRQVLHKTSGIGKPKALSAAEAMRDINPHVTVSPYVTTLCAENAPTLIEQYDFVVDCPDNFDTRYLTNSVCARLGKPNVHGSVSRFDGRMTVFWAERGPCYRCLQPEPPDPPASADKGILGMLPGVIGSLQAIEAIKLITGVGDLAVGRLIIFDALTMKMREAKIRKDPMCPVCGATPTAS